MRERTHWLPCNSNSLFRLCSVQNRIVFLSVAILISELDLALLATARFTFVCTVPMASKEVAKAVGSIGGPPAKRCKASGSGAANASAPVGDVAKASAPAEAAKTKRANVGAQSAALASAPADAAASAEMDAPAGAWVNRQQADMDELVHSMLKTMMYQLHVSHCPSADHVQVAFPGSQGRGRVGNPS